METKILTSSIKQKKAFCRSKQQQKTSFCLLTDQPSLILFLSLAATNWTSNIYTQNSRANFYIEVSFNFTLRTLCLSQGWKRYGFHCYLVGSALLTFSEANKTCEQSKAYLATVESRYENIFLYISKTVLLMEKLAKLVHFFWILQSALSALFKNFVVVSQIKLSVQEKKKDSMI